MGVTLSLDGGRQARPRRRGQHARSAEEQACMDAFAALLRSDAEGAARCLSRVTKGTLGSRVLPAAKSLAEAADLMLTTRTEPRQVEIDLSLSAACLTGQRRPAACELCLSPTCQHDCHLERSRAALASRGAQP